MVIIATYENDSLHTSPVLALSASDSENTRSGENDSSSCLKSEAVSIDTAKCNFTGFSVENESAANSKACSSLLVDNENIVDKLCNPETEISQILIDEKIQVVDDKKKDNYNSSDISMPSCSKLDKLSIVDKNRNTFSPVSTSQIDSGEDTYFPDFAAEEAILLENSGLSITMEDSLSIQSEEFLPLDVIKEEKKLAKQTELYLNNQAVEKLDESEKQKRYKTLMMLLGKSSQYAVYMSEKLLKEKENLKNDNPEKSSTAKSKIPKSSITRKRKYSSVKGGSSKKLKKGNNIEISELDNNVEAEKEQMIPSDCYINDFGYTVSKRQPRLFKGGIMRDYQLDGLDWLIALYKNAVNGILADEMGLGKTIQILALLCHLREKNIYGPHLIIGPLSTLPNWLCEFANFTPDIPVLLFHGPLNKRTEIKRKFAEILKKGVRENIPVILTSYEMPLFDKKFFRSIRWTYTIVDEGHRLKNYKSLLSQELRTYRTESRLLLTGTPLQNNLTELWSLLNYLIPEIFDDLPMFETLFDFSDLGDSQKQNELIQREKEEQVVTKMHQILEPFLLRRMKCEVNIQLPRKKEVLVFTPLTPTQEKLYKAILDKSIERLKNSDLTTGFSPIIEDNGKRSKRKCAEKRISYSEQWEIDENYEYLPKFLFEKSSEKKSIIKEGIEYIFNVLMSNPGMMLRKVVNHPYLVRTPITPGTRDIIINEDLITECGKFLVLDALLPKLKQQGRKILLFSYFKILLDLVEDYVIMRNYKYVRLDGCCNLDSRLESIKQFNSDPNIFIFLITTRAGGLGVNLTAADTVIIYDSDWNPQADRQAQDRCHRIGQTKPVVVYRLVSAGTYDQRIVEIATDKRRLEQLVMKKGKFNFTKCKDDLSIKELYELFNATDYKKVIHPNGLVLSDQQIEELLDRSDLINESDDNN